MGARLRRVLKSVTWRVTATSTTLIIVFLLTKQFKIAGSVALLEIILKTVVYYLHETIWDKYSLLTEHPGECE